MDRAADPALDRARARLCGADRAHHPHLDARSAGGGLHPHRARERRRDALDAAQACAEECRRADRHRDRHRRRAADRRRRDHRDGVQHSGRRAPRGRRDLQARLPDHPGRDPDLLRRLRAGESRWSTSATPCSIRGSAIERRHRRARIGRRERPLARRAAAPLRAAQSDHRGGRDDPRPDRAAGDRGAAVRRRRHHDAAGAAAAPALGGELARHRSSRPRRVRPHGLWRAGLAVRRHLGRRDVDLGRPVHRADVRLLPQGRRRRDAADGRPDGDPGDPAGDRAGGADARQRLDRDRGDHDPGSSARGAAGARGRAQRARGALRRGRGRGRHADLEDPAAPHPAEHRSRR